MAGDRSAGGGVSGGQDDPTTGPSQESQLPLLVTVEEAGRLLGIGRTKAYGLVMGGTIRSVTIGRRRLVPRASISEFVEKLASGETSIEI
jgi:excisionase family DNA binding protein